LAAADITDRLSRESSTLQIIPRQAGSLRAVREQYEADSRELLLKPVEQFLLLRPIRQSLETMQECDREIAGRAARARSGIDKRFQRLLVQTALDLCEPWRIRRSGNCQDDWHDWDRRRVTHLKEGSVLMEQYARWAADAAKAGPATETKQATARHEVWWRQHRSVAALLEMEVALRDLGIVWFDATEAFVESVLGERERILSQAEQTLHWIQAGAEPETAATAEMLELASPDERLRVWAYRIENEAASRLPERLELITPGNHPRWRSISARKAFLTAFATYAQVPMRQIAERYWSGSAGIVREVSRAREIVEYWRDAPSTNAEEASTPFADALHNGSDLLAKNMQTGATGDELGNELTGAFWVWTGEGAAALEAAQYGWAVLLRRPRGRRLLRTAMRTVPQKTQKAVQHISRNASDRLDRALESVAGRVPIRPTTPAVVRRATLRDTLSLPASKSDLPTLYRFLFQLVPVEDRRFLVGRSQELAGLDQAAKDWKAGRFAACLVIGARGSGKTSLLNCAAREVFAGLQLVRGQFRERVLSPEKIDSFLRQMLRLRDGVDLEEALAAERRVLVIEESERTYLRKVGGFGGAHRLIHLIHRTASTTLWVIVMNDKAFRALEAGAEFGRAFSHRINAMSVSRDDLENAILERHRLSGYQLEFAPPPAGDPRISRARKWMGLQDQPQKLFFDSLFQHSEGVIRSAFELWLSSIERAEGGTLKIRQPLDPSYSGFRNELAQEDHFTLLAIQEHGSLTQDELAEVLCEANDASRSRLDRLSALGLIEPDPNYPGLRVRPEAQRFTADLLRRANLT
jgi:hypothetical protein